MTFIEEIYSQWSGKFRFTITFPSIIIFQIFLQCIYSIKDTSKHINFTEHTQSHMQFSDSSSFAAFDNFLFVFFFSFLLGLKACMIFAYWRAICVDRPFQQPLNESSGSTLGWIAHQYLQIHFIYFHTFASAGKPSFFKLLDACYARCTNNECVYSPQHHGLCRILTLFFFFVNALHSL